MKYKVGDKVRVREDLIIGEQYGALPFVGMMKKQTGEVVTIRRVYPNLRAYEIAEDGGNAYWTEKMLEPIEDPLVKKIEERNHKPKEPYTPPNTGDPWIDNLPEEYFTMYEEEDAVKPTHYQNNGKDLFEEWFERYNDNGKTYTGKEVFIEIMKSVAERYIRRYPNKGEYDLQKGIYTLERLKEYEELEEEE